MPMSPLPQHAFAVTDVYSIETLVLLAQATHK